MFELSARFMEEIELQLGLYLKEFDVKLSQNELLSVTGWDLINIGNCTYVKQVIELIFGSGINFYRC